MEYLFVYGTLLNSFDNEVLKPLQPYMHLLHYGYAKGRLYDLGEYPAFTETSAPADRVKGEVYRIEQAARVLAILDEYEGAEYIRKKKLVRLDAHKNIRCWIYVYRLKPAPAHKRIITGDYLAFIRNKVNNG